MKIISALLRSKHNQNKNMHLWPRMKDKVKQVLDELLHMTNSMETTYNSGVVDGFSKKPCT